MLHIKSIACVFLLSCWTKLLTNKEFQHCPDFCDCYSAPKDGEGADIAYSVMCNFNGLTKRNAKTFAKLNSLKTSINTFVFDNFSTFNLLEPLHKIKVNNLVLKDIGMTNEIVTRLGNVLDSIKKDSLQVLTVLNVNFKSLFQFDDPDFKKFNKLKVIYFERGKLEHITGEFDKIPGHNIVSATFDSVGLVDIDKASFKNYKKLRNLTIIRNSIEDLNWMLDLKLPELEYLDLRHNQLTSFPHKLAKLKSLKVLKLGQNKIRTIDGNTMDLLINKLLELSFYKIYEAGDKSEQEVSRQDYFYPTQEMSWIVDVLQSGRKYKKLPKYLRESLDQMECVKTCSLINVLCRELRKEQFTFKISSELTTDILNTSDNDTNNDEYILSYENQRVFLSGAVLPYGTKTQDEMSESTSKWFKNIKDKGGNVVKIAVHWEDWYTHVQITNRVNSHIFDMDKFQADIQTFESFLELAKDNNIFVIITLWTSDKSPSATLKYITVDKSHFDDYLIKLKILVERLNKYKSLAAWELVDDPNRLLVVSSSTVKCRNTSNINVLSAELDRIDIKTMQTFIAEQAKLIHSLLPRKLVTISINEYDSHKFNLYEDECLKSAMNNKLDDIYLDFYLLGIDHEIDIGGARMVSEKSPKPVVVVARPKALHIERIFTILYGSEFEGVLGYYDELDDEFNKWITNGMNAFKGQQHVIGPNYDNPYIN